MNVKQVIAAFEAQRDVLEDLRERVAYLEGLTQRQERSWEGLRANVLRIERKVGNLEDDVGGLS